MSGDDVVDLTGDEDPTDEDGDIGVSVSLGDEIYSEGKKSRESSIGDSDNTGDGGKTAGRAIITWGGGIASLISESEGTIESLSKEILGAIIQRDVGRYYPKRYWEILPKEILGDITQRDIGRYYPKRYWEILPKEILGDINPKRYYGDYYPKSYGRYYPKRYWEILPKEILPAGMDHKKPGFELEGSKMEETVEYGVSTSIEYGVSNFLSNTVYSSHQINTAYPLSLDTAYRSSKTEANSKFSCMTRSSTNDLFIPYKEPEREFRSSRRHFKTLSLDELRSPDFNLLSDQEYSEEEEAKAMAETMEQYMSNTRTDYGSLDVPTRQILDSRGAIPTKTTEDAKKAIQEMAEYSQKWHNGTSRGRSTETSDGLAAIQAQLNNLGREIKKNSKLLYKSRQTTLTFPSRLDNHYCEEEEGNYGPKFMEAYGASHINDTIHRKEKDPRSFTLPCFINNTCFDNALVDLGASISVMPLLTYLNLGSGELAHTRLTVELADRTVKYPKGIAENVLV
ncbi:hypothetical protein Tco_1034323, partial [Tanacetum coccineum]